MKKIVALTVIGTLAGTSLGLSGCAHEKLPDTRPQSFMMADKNHDNRMSYGEYQDYLRLRAEQNEADARQVLFGNDPNREKTILVKFQGYDMNRDTFVDQAEIGIVR